MAGLLPHIDATDGLRDACAKALGDLPSRHL